MSAAPDPSEAVSEGSRVVGAIEAAYDHLRAFCPELPVHVVVTTGTGRSARSLLWGQHCHGEWVDRDGEPRTRLFISGETLSRGGEFVWTVITHEAAHELARVRGLRDCSGQANRYHNAKFLECAEALGCWFPGVDPHPTRGFTNVELRASTIERFAEPIAVLDDALTVSILPATRVPTRGGDRNNMRFTCECEPPRIMRMSAKCWELGAPLCPVCEAEFA